MARGTTYLAKRASRRNMIEATGAMLGLTAASGTVTGRATRSRVRESRDGPRVTAHRGFRDVFPQNTVAAVEGASRLGADRIEIDAVATGDGEIVVFHDERLDDLTDESGPVAETPAETVLDAEVLGSGETVPTLARALEAAESNVTMNVEFKASGPLSWTEFAERALRVASRESERFYVSSFDPDALRAVTDVSPHTDVAPIFGRNAAENLEIARELDAEAVNCSLGVLDRDLVETAHDEGREVNVWTVDTWREARAPIELGADGLIADYPNMTAFAAGGSRGSGSSQ
ncbi:glycerophosphodiester phosphodiesterase [Haloarcula nitratireducens]|uniref:Glycerophosphodiester phosphodiesterase n=1 Tax=Haloarcula nitratireducens TaxID=2487749 RepID=A0AAW4PFN4_9EURY|nr:glycerophosphodiester phosphodiesterase [Halomicroarcula nitratireducens]MBX0296473.1 glycerophosphodiester phosphodiesterase [Halomicroarcula nitratireducens]